MQKVVEPTWRVCRVGESKRSTQVRSLMIVGELMAVIVFGGQSIVPPRTPDARSAQSKVVKVRFQSYAPTLRCRYVATTRLLAEKDSVTAPSLRPRRGFAVLAKCFRLYTASPPAHPRSDVATWQQLVDKLYDCLDTTFTATHFLL